MYIIKDQTIEKIKNYKQKYIAFTIGLHPATLSNIVCKKPILEKKVAYCLTKFLDSEKEIEDFFEYVERDQERK